MLDIRTHLGVVLQASYRVLAGVPVLHFYGRLQDGRPFLVRESRQRPFFYVHQPDARRVRQCISELSLSRGKAQWPQVRLNSGKRTMDGAPVSRVEVAVPADVPSLRDRLHERGLETFEADVRFAMRYLIDRDVRGGCAIRGAEKPGAGKLVVFDDPDLQPADVEVVPRVLSFDIETDPTADRLLAIAVYGLGADEVLVVDQPRRPLPEGARGFTSEREALTAFCKLIETLDPDVLTGWNVVDFDLTFLSRVAARVKHPFLLGRDDVGLRIRAPQGYFGSGSASISGRLVLDGVDLLRGAFVRMDRYGLDAVAREVLGEGKALAGEVDDRVEEILSNFRHDLPAFCHYARTDARLALEIVERLDLVNLAFARSALTGMPPDRVAASIASFDFLYLSALGRRGRVAPTVRSNNDRVHVAQAGGHVLEPQVGVHSTVWVFDFKSLYPSLIRTFNIDPLGFVPGTAVAGQGEDSVIRLENGAAFRRERAILPEILDQLFPRREAARQRGDAVASQAIKILMNSFYGVLGTPACRFYNPDIANAITGQGRHFLLWSKSWFESRGYEVLYGDTDSLFVASGIEEPREAGRLAEQLAAEIDADLQSYIRQRWSLESALELEFEKMYLRLFLPSVRHGAGGARKRYAGLRWREEGTSIEFVGMEVVRRDWTELAKQVQRELYQRLFADAPVDNYLAEVVRELRRGDLDDLLVYRKGLRKNLESYTASTPPHVVAARKSSRPPGRIISYIVTTAGPEPLDALTREPDREHYVDRQIRPVAEPVLQTLGLSFAQVIGDDRQIGLF